MRVKDWIIVAFAIIIAVLLLTRKNPPSADYSEKYDSLKTVVNNSYNQISKARTDSVNHVREISQLRAQIQRTHEDKAKTVQSYQKKIRALESLKIAQTDSILSRQYGEPLDTRRILVDLEGGKQAKELHQLATLEISHLNGIVESYQGIVRSDSLQIAELTNIIAANDERHRLKEKEYAELKNRERKLRRANVWLKIGLPVAFLAGIFVP